MMEQQSRRSVESLLRALLVHNIADGVFSGAICAVGTSAGEAYRVAVGTTDWEGPAVGDATYWDLASLTKAIVATLFARAASQGRISYEDTVGAVLTRFAATNKASLTARSLLNHTSGIPGQIRMYRWCHSPEDMMAALEDLPLTGAPGERVQYSSQGFMLAGLMLESATGQSLGEALAEIRTAGPGLRYWFDLDRESPVASTEYCAWRKRLIQGEVHDENAAVWNRDAGHAGMFSRIEDISTFVRYLSTPELAGELGVLPWAYRELTQARPGTPLPHRSAGLQIAETAETLAGTAISPNGFGHTGYTGTSFWIDPERGRYTVLLTNRVIAGRDGTRINMVRRRLNDIWFGNEGNTQ